MGEDVRELRGGAGRPGCGCGVCPSSGQVAAEMGGGGRGEEEARASGEAGGAGCGGTGPSVGGVRG